MARSHDLTNRQRRKKERRVWRFALLASLVLHALIFLFWKDARPLPSPFSAAGPRAGDNRAAAGALQAMNLRTAPRVPQVTPPIPVPTLEEVEPVEIDEDISIEPSEGTGEAEGDENVGIEDGTGEGDGGTAAEGRNRLTPPTPRGMIIPPTNRDLKGEEVEVWVFVNERGRVVPDSTQLRPPTSDRSFNRRLVEEAAEWVFVPARREGEPVASWFPYRISM